MNRATVLLLHSSGASPRQWMELVETLRHDCRVLSVEFHGHGQRPEWPHPRPMALGDDAALAVPLLQMVEGAHVIGHSYGGAVALKLASMHPGLVHSVVAYEPVLFRLVFDDRAHPEHAREVVRAVDLMRRRLQDGEAGQAGHVFVDFWSGAGAWNQMSARARQAVELRMPAVIRHFEALFAEPFPREQLAHSTLPMLLLSGGRSVPTGHRIAQLLRMALPLARHEEITGIGHLGPITHPHLVNERIREFLRHEAHALH